MLMTLLKNFTLTYNDGPLNVDLNQDYYLFGTQYDEGQTFFSSGPKVVEMVLRILRVMNRIHSYKAVRVLKGSIYIINRRINCLGLEIR